jgi:ABC-type Mn2+/Zn2+ transport system permease subunit
MLLDLLALMWVPFLMCLVLTGIHAYLGIHVIAREVVFVDIALAQIAALGATAAFLVGFDPEDPGSYWFGLAATIAGALVLALTRSRTRHVSQEAVIGVVYAVSSAAAVLLADRSPHGAEHLRTMLVGSILAVRAPDVAKVAVLYTAVGLFHWLCRRPFFLISLDPGRAFREGWRIRLWDFLFYASFGVVVASSVRVAGVLLVFSYLIVPRWPASRSAGRSRPDSWWAGRSGRVSACWGCSPRPCSICPRGLRWPACSVSPWSAGPASSGFAAWRGGQRRRPRTPWSRLCPTKECHDGPIAVRCRVARDLWWPGVLSRPLAHVTFFWLALNLDLLSLSLLEVTSLSRCNSDWSG